MGRFLRRVWPLVAAFMLMIVMVPGPAYAGGFLTDEDPMIALDASAPDGSRVRAIVSSGDVVDGVLFEGIPDGVGIKPGPKRGTIDVYVAHEQTTVPFFGSADFVDASITHLTLGTRRGNRGAVLAADVALPSSEGFLRFCSAAMVGPAEGFDDYVFLTGEETDDIVDVVPNAIYGADPAIDPQRQGGYAVALDTASGDYTHIPGMGRLNHENTIALPGYREIVLVTTDDTFNGPSAQLYMYTARNQDAVFQDRGELLAFQVTDDSAGAVDPNDPYNGANDYLDLQPGDDFAGRFIPVPDDVADGTLDDLAPQAGLEQWSNDRNVFQFIRLEDLAYDKNDPNVVYIADTGRSRVVPDPTTGRLVRGPSGTVGFADNGRVFKMVFDEHDPTQVVSLTVLADADVPADSSVYVPFTSPDNLDTSTNSLMIQEDTDDAKVWRHDYASSEWSVVATVTDPDGESSGIVDASDWYGPGSWLLTVQGHGENVEEEQVGDVLYKRESGQLLLLKIPGS